MTQEMEIPQDLIFWGIAAVVMVIAVVALLNSASASSGSWRDLFCSIEVAQYFMKGCGAF